MWLAGIIQRLRNSGEDICWLHLRLVQVTVGAEDLDEMMEGHLFKHDVIYIRTLMPDTEFCPAVRPEEILPIYSTEAPTVKVMKYGSAGLTSFCNVQSESQIFLAQED